VEVEVEVYVEVLDDGVGSRRNYFSVQDVW
jgi:hypothetical protein